MAQALAEYRQQFPAVCVEVHLTNRFVDLVGEGIALVPDSFTRERLQERGVLRVLPSWATTESPNHLVYPAQRQVLPKVRAMIPILEKHFVHLITR